MEDKPTRIHQIPLLLAQITAGSDIASYVRQLRVAGSLQKRNPLRLGDRNDQLLQLLQKLPHLLSFT